MPAVLSEKIAYLGYLSPADKLLGNLLHRNAALTYHTFILSENDSPLPEVVLFIPLHLAVKPLPYLFIGKSELISVHNVLILQNGTERRNILIAHSSHIKTGRNDHCSLHLFLSSVSLMEKTQPQ